MFLLPIVIAARASTARCTPTGSACTSRAARIHTIGIVLWFVALPLTTLAEITALGFTGPIFVTIGAALFLGEDVRLRRWLAVIVGFIGAMIIIRPGFSALHIGVICILVSTPIFSASNLISKALARTDSANTIVIWQNIVIVACGRALRHLVLADAELDRPGCGSWRPAPPARWATSASSAATSSPTSRCCSRSASCR